jgi:pyruvate dehydrogenase E2 component (dihydrolipoyllysine-residue acetyltransferase)
MHDVTMPKLSDSMEVGKIIAWHVAEGDAVKTGDVLADIESDKAQMELEAFHDGAVLKIAHADGDEVPVGEVIAFIGEAGEEIEAQGRQEPKAEAKPEDRPSTIVHRPSAVPLPKDESRKAKDVGRPAISPYARKLAAERGVDVATLKGSGPDGRVVAEDVLKASSAGSSAVPVAVTPKLAAKKANVDAIAVGMAAKLGVELSSVNGTGLSGRITVEDVIAAHESLKHELPPAPDEEAPALEVSAEEADVVPASFRQKTIARKMVESKHAVPHFYITRGANVTKLLARKAELKQNFGATVTHVIALAVLKTIARHPNVNQSYDRGRLIKWKGVNLGLAVATDDGLTVAVLHGAEQLGLADIVKRSGELIERARAGKLTSQERSHATFTLSNLGTHDVEHFAAIINPPSSITMAVASALDEPVVVDGKLEVGKVMRLTLSCDHRAVDGVAGAEFLRDLKNLLESPAELLGRAEQ